MTTDHLVTATLTPAIIDLRAKATRFRDQRLRSSGVMVDECADLWHAFEEAADVLQRRLARAQRRHPAELL